MAHEGHTDVFFCGLVTLDVPFLEELSRQRIWGRLRHEPSPSPLP